jgi:hypothetical protein
LKYPANHGCSIPTWKVPLNVPLNSTVLALLVYKNAHPTMARLTTTDIDVLAEHPPATSVLGWCVKVAHVFPAFLKKSRLELATIH